MTVVSIWSGETTGLQAWRRLSVDCMQSICFVQGGEPAQLCYARLTGGKIRATYLLPKVGKWYSQSLKQIPDGDFEVFNRGESKRILQCFSLGGN